MSKDIVRLLSIVGGVLCLLPISLLYLFGLIFLLTMVVAGSGTLLSKLGWLITILAPGFFLYSAWRLLFSVDLLINDSGKKPAVHLWAGLGMGFLLSVYICVATPGNLGLLLTFGAPTILAVVLAGLYVHSERGDTPLDQEPSL